MGGPWEKYAAQSTEQGPWTKYAAQQTQEQPEEPGILDRQIPLTSYGNATLSGVQSVGRGVRDATIGFGKMIQHPIDTLSSAAQLPSQAAQVPGAISDINRSPDPVGTYAKVAQETAGQGAGQALFALGSAAGVRAAKKLPGAVHDISSGANVAARQGAIPEAASLPPKAVLGAENIFRAAAPTGSNPGFRANVYAAAGDLAEIGRNTDLAEAKGGIVNPDLRVRATVQAINDHLSDMYQNERLPQIQRNASTPANVSFSADAAEGVKYLSRSTGAAADRALAQKAASGQSLTIAEADRLAKITNKELIGFQSMTPAERAAASATSKRLTGLKSLDSELGNAINSQLQSAGEDGLKPYERRYAALSEIRDQLQSRMNAVELKQPGMFKRVVKPMVATLTGGTSGVASASQAAVADVNIGRMLQNGFKTLADSSLQPERVGAAPPLRPAPHGLLRSAPIQLGSSATPLDPTTSAPPPILRRPIAGLLKPAARGLGSGLEPADQSPTGVLNAVRRIVRDPKTGRMKVQYLTGNQ